MSTNNICILSRGVIIDQDNILLCKTLDLAVSFYFLPGGHVEHGESASRALVRELEEEAGTKCRIKRFLGCLEYSFEPSYSSFCHNHEYNFIFEIEPNDFKIDKQIPQLESHIELVWIPLNQLSMIDFRAEPLKKLVPYWLEFSHSDIFKSVMI